MTHFNQLFLLSTMIILFIVSTLLTPSSIGFIAAIIFAIALLTLFIMPKDESFARFSAILCGIIVLHSVLLIISQFKTLILLIILIGIYTFINALYLLNANKIKPKRIIDEPLPQLRTEHISQEMTNKEQEVKTKRTKTTKKSTKKPKIAKKTKTTKKSKKAKK